MSWKKKFNSPNRSEPWTSFIVKLNDFVITTLYYENFDQISEDPGKFSRNLRKMSGKFWIPMVIRGKEFQSE